jgi:hypothetical protein
MFSRSAALFLAMLVLLLYAGKPAAAHEKEEGTVVKAGGGKLVLTSKGKEKPNTREVAKDAPVTINGRPAKLEDLKEGFHVVVALGEKHLVTKIEAQSKAK